MFLISWQKRLTPILLSGSCRVTRSNLSLLFPRLNTLSHSFDVCSRSFPSSNTLGLLQSLNVCPKLKIFFFLPHALLWRLLGTQNCISVAETGSTEVEEQVRMGAEKEKTCEAIVMELHYSPISGICREYALARACYICRKWESRVLNLYSSYLFFLAEADFSFP